jgi:hypothetical protein
MMSAKVDRKRWKIRTGYEGIARHSCFTAPTLGRTTFTQLLSDDVCHSGQAEVED